MFLSTHIPTTNVYVNGGRVFVFITLLFFFSFFTIFDNTVVCTRVTDDGNSGRHCCRVSVYIGTNSVYGMYGTRLIPAAEAPTHSCVHARLDPRARMLLLQSHSVTSRDHGTSSITRALRPTTTVVLQLQYFGNCISTWNSPTIITIDVVSDWK